MSKKVRLIAVLAAAAAVFTAFAPLADRAEACFPYCY